MLHVLKRIYEKRRITIKLKEAEGLWGAVEMQMSQITRNMCAYGTTFLVLKAPGTATEVEWF